MQRNQKLTLRKIFDTKPLREYASIQKIILLGQGSKFELWSENIWNKNMKSWLERENIDEVNNDALTELKLLGKYMNSIHNPVLLDQVIESLNIISDGTYVDCTLAEEAIQKVF